MDFDFSEPQRLLLDSAKCFFEKEGKDQARKIEKEAKQFLPEFWRKMAELGWMGIVFPEEYGGTEGDFVDLVLLLQEMGKALIPGPYIATIVSGLAILCFGSEEQKKTLLPLLAEGKLIAIPALFEPKGQTGGRKQVESVLPKQGGYEVNGTRLFVPYAHVADRLLYACEWGKGKTFFLIDAKSVGVSSFLLPTIAVDGQCQVTLANVQVPREDRLGMEGGGEVISASMEEWGALAQSAFILGLLEKVLSLTVEHAKQREQFGKPIGSFQAIQHQCADMATEIDKIRFLVYRAAWQLGRKMPASKEISMAKAKASDASRKVCLLGIKIHGGIGISEEHDLQLYFRKAKAAEIDFGDGAFHREIIAHEMGL